MVEKLRVKTVISIRAGVHSQLLRVRTILRITESDEFKTAFDLADSESKEKVIAIIEKGDRDAFEIWLKEEIQKRIGVDEMSIRELRKLGQKLSVRGYNILPKAILVDRVKREQSNERRTNCSVESPNLGDSRLDAKLDTQVRPD